ncbi:uncharacterized protein [Macrobrachium rosenbergii]|uniref:uncharacterized protein n=1 Tax=Macrobrachium rosenbergii TaxID=79674 RepID=UPI0034D6F32F
MAAHKHKCNMNYSGKSGGMEWSAAIRMWARSRELKLCYETMLSDGDSTAFDKVKEQNDGKGPYYDIGVTVRKIECVNHVCKRFRKALENLKMTYVKVVNGRRMKLLAGKNKLTDDVIEALTFYYGHAIKKFAGTSVEEMRRAILAGFHHCSSTDECHNHDYCDKSVDTYCFYQKAVMNNEVPQSHSTTKVKFIVDEEGKKQIFEVYKRMTSDELLEACLHGQTQNRNESLHSRLWRYCPKSKNGSKRIIDFAAAQDVANYNAGYTASHLDYYFGFPRTEISSAYLARMDANMDLPFKKKAKHKRKIVKDPDYEAGAASLPRNFK